MKTAIITGITGQDGSYLSKLLLEKGYRVVGITRNSQQTNLTNLQYLGIASSVIIEECDLLDLPYVLRIIEKYEPTEVYSLGAQSSVGLSFSQPTATIEYNINSVLNLLEAIRIANKSIRFYQASSSEMYGKVTTLPVSLTTPMHPLSPYAISKAACFWTGINFRESFGLWTCSGVLFNHESYLRPSNFFVKKIINQSIRIRDGELDKLYVGNLDVKRDFGYAPKYVEAMWLMLQQNEPRDFIVCSGKSVSLRSIVEHVLSILKLDPSIIHKDPDLFRPVDIEDIYGDNSDAKKYLGWSYDLDFMNVLEGLVEEEQRNMSRRK